MKKKLHETEVERRRRKKEEEIINEYLHDSYYILAGSVTPTRLLKELGAKHKMTRQGLIRILRKYNIYESAKNPVVISSEAREILGDK